MRETKHTPTPWLFEQDTSWGHDDLVVRCPENEWTVLRVRDSATLGREADDIANMQFIVRACNSFDELLEALIKFRDATQSWHDFHKHTPGLIQCDELCELIAPGSSAISKAESK